MGMGAVMGAKKLKAIVLKGGSPPPLADAAAAERVSADFAAAIPHNVLASWQKNRPGFAVWVHDHGIDAALDVDNFRTASFVHTDRYDKPHWAPYYRGVAACPGCANDCMKVYHVVGRGDARASAMHQEVTGAMGPNIGTPDVATLIAYNTRLNELGMDPVSLGFTLSMAMELRECGLLTAADLDGLDLRFGNVEATQAMIERIARREGIGNVLAEGVKRAAAHLGRGAETFAMHVKGLEMVPFEPRSQTNLATGFAVAPTGPRYDICEHDWDYDVDVGWGHTLDLSRTLGIHERIPMEHLGVDKVRNYKALNTLWVGGGRALLLHLRRCPDPYPDHGHDDPPRRGGDRVGDFVIRADAHRRAAKPPVPGLQQPGGTGSGGGHAARPLLRRGHLRWPETGSAPGSGHLRAGSRDPTTR